MHHIKGSNYLQGKNTYAFSYLFSKEDKSHATASKFIEKEQHSMNFTYSRKFINEISLISQFGYTFHKFKDLATSSQKREDNNYLYYISLRKKIDEMLSAALEIKHTNNDSNYVPVKYKKNNYLVKLNMNF